MIDAEGLQKLLPQIKEIKDPSLRRGVIDIWLDIAASCPWERLEDVPKNNGAGRNRSILGHTRGVARLALAIGEITEAEQGTPFDRDLLLAASLLHDASKPLEYEPDPDGPPTNGSVPPGRKSAMGQKIQHGVYTAHKIFEKGLPLELAHLIITHTEESNIRSKSFEAVLLKCADRADSDTDIAPKKG